MEGLVRWPGVPLLLRFYRAGALALIVLLLHEQARWLEAQRGGSISLRQARKYFPTANRVQLGDPAHGWHFVTDARGDTIGCLLTTSPQSDHIIGYSGPTDLLIALDPRGAIAGLEIVRSGDTKEHVERIKHDPSFLRSFVGWKPAEAPAPKIAGVSGATLTSFAIAEIIQQRLGGSSPSLRFPEPVTLAEVQTLITNASVITPDRSRFRVLDQAGHVLGFAARTSPEAENVSGYRGPTECLVALAPDGRKVTGIRLRRSYDTESYVDQVRRDEHYLKQFVGRTIDQLATLDWKTDKIEGVSGATQTSRAVAEGLKRHFSAELNKPITAVARWKPKQRDWALGSIISGGMIMSFSSLRGYRWVRTAWQLLLVVYVGFINHDLLSLALFGGWAANGVALQAAPGLVLLAGAALLIPLTTRRQLYCHQICPHGAAQQLLGKIFSYRWSPPPRVTRVLEFIPGALLAFAILAVLLGTGINLSSLEPFDAWVWKTASVITLAIAIVGLGASLFIPQAYCHFGCPTGALLNFIRSAGSGDRWGRRDWGALILLAAGLISVVGARSRPRTEPEPQPVILHGRTMGTTWTVKIRDEVADPGAIEKAIANQYEWAEAMTSHWRSNTDLSIFNHTLTTNEMSVPWPVLTLAKWAAEISERTGGAYDITVGPLVRLWGFGPAAPRTVPPTDAEVAALMPAVGWRKLELHDGMIRKQHPSLEIDFSSIVPGWANDLVAELLQRRGYTNFLVESGGELRAKGRWAIAIEHPARTCILLNESIGTSGTYRQKYDFRGQRYSHLIDARTGHSVSHRTVTVSVRYEDCAHADGWGAALNVLGFETGYPLAEQLKLAAQFVVEQNDGKLVVHETQAWQARERLSGVGTGSSR